MILILTRRGLNSINCALNEMFSPYKKSVKKLILKFAHIGFLIADDSYDSRGSHGYVNICCRNLVFVYTFGIFLLVCYHCSLTAIGQWFVHLSR